MIRRHKIVVSTVAVVTALVLAVIFLPKLFNSNSGVSENSYNGYIKVLNDSYPSDIIVYGEDIGFRSTLNYRVITEINEENLTSDPKYQYSFFVINDRSGSLKITDREFALCKKLADENNQSFFYIGQQYVQKLREFDFYDQLLTDQGSYYGVAYVISPFEPGHGMVHGFWMSTEEEHYLTNNELLGHILTLHFVDTIKRFN